MSSRVHSNCFDIHLVLAVLRCRWEGRLSSDKAGPLDAWMGSFGGDRVLRGRGDTLRGGALGWPDAATTG